MSKKKLNIILIIFVLGLWGTVAYKTINQYFFPKELALSTIRSNATFNFNENKKDTFNLNTIQRDPFLNKSNEPPKAIVVKSYAPPKIIVKPVVKPIAPIIWPTVSYYGYIKSKDKTEELILVKINNQLHKVRKNDQIGDVIIKRVFNDSIEVYLNKEKKMISIK